MAPVVMISANGLICLALYHRLAAVVRRLRLFYREQFDTRARLSAMSVEELAGKLARQLQARMDALQHQYSIILLRARLLRNALVLLLLAVLGMLLCALALGLSLVHGAFEVVALYVFVASVLIMMAGVTLAIRELRIALEPVKTERGTLV